MNRRKFNSLVLAGGALGLTAASASSLPAAFRDRKNSNGEKSPAELITTPTKKAVEKALAYLHQRQIKTGRNRGAFANSGMASGVATCSLGRLAFMCGGHAPGFGKYGKTIDF